MSRNFDSPIERHFCGSIPDEAEAKCEHKHTYSYSEVSELGAVAKSGMRKCVACGAEIYVRSAELPVPQPSAQSVEHDLESLFERERNHILPNGHLASEYREAIGSRIESVAPFSVAYNWHDKPHRLVYDLLRCIDHIHTENASLRQQLTAERAAHEVTKKALELCCLENGDTVDEFMSYAKIRIDDSSASSPSQEGL